MTNNKLFDTKADYLITLIIFVASYVLYYTACKELLLAGFYEQINIAFDLDQSYYFDMVWRNSSDWLFKTNENPQRLNLKHPFISLYYYIVVVLNALDFSGNMAVIILSQTFHSGSLVISYFVFRSMGRTTLESSALIIGLAGTSTYISSGLVLDTYTISIFWIAALFLIICKAEYQQTECPVWLRAVVSIMAIGTTSYLITLVVMTEFFLVKRRGESFLNSFLNKGLYMQLLRIIVLGIGLVVFIYYQVVCEFIQDPVGILKRIFWAVNRQGEKTGIFQVITVFTIFSIISPKVSHVMLPESINMIDLREMEFNYLGWFVLFIMALSLIFKGRNTQHAFILLFSLSWLIINIIFHTLYQDRGSLFIYSGHFILAVFILYFTPIKLAENGSIWQRHINQGLDRVIIYGLPFLIGFNNLYLYREVMGILKG